MKSFAKYLRLLLVLLPIVLLIVLMLQKDRIMNQLSEVSSRAMMKNNLASDSVVTYQEFDLEKKRKPAQGTLLEFGAENCISCRRMKTTLKEIELKFAEQLDIQVYNITTAEGLAMSKRFGMVMIPMQVLLNRKGQVIYKHIGYVPSEELASEIKMKLSIP